ncbi:DMT family transporter [Clostridium felsineum]|uniref:DMT family transporter n=1 Tax=Clostridium felsineum TaxID=36839 RepID=UPI00098C8E8D|nr:EamA family transporter [Clostridium felsineum]URZ01481.1 putative inner membrane transporter YicL [Clostridium felsineum]
MTKEENLKDNYLRKKGFIFAISASTLWGVSGITAQFLFQEGGFSPEWLVVVRLLVAGSFLLAITQVKTKKNIFRVFKNKHDAFSFIIFGFGGMLAVQYTYFVTIKYSNAATATILQYLSPVIITLYLIIYLKKWPSIYEILAILLALIGTFFIITKGDIKAINISERTLFWGIISAIAAAVNTLQPRRILAKWGSNLVAGWGMIIGGVLMSIIHNPFNFVGKVSLISVSFVIVVIIIGTLIPFWLYMESIKIIKPTEASILGAFEPLSAAILSLVFLGIHFSILEWVGSIFIILTTIILSTTKK